MRIAPIQFDNCIKMSMMVGFKPFYTHRKILFCLCSIISKIAAEQTTERKKNACPLQVKIKQNKYQYYNRMRPQNKHFQLTEYENPLYTKYQAHQISGTQYKYACHNSFFFGAANFCLTLSLTVIYSVHSWLTESNGLFVQDRLAHLVVLGFWSGVVLHRLHGISLCLLQTVLTDTVMPLNNISAHSLYKLLPLCFIIIVHHNRVPYIII